MTIDEIRMLLGICYRQLQALKDDETLDFTSLDRVELQEISEKIESAHDDLYPWAPDQGYL